ncbi:unnamed protein product [Linum trigynum]|uniref:Uncharacterized protein n=1 Tax=Linum trigynum TaxID=586398 RepID=A0AAV2F941_9ROSI
MLEDKRQGKRLVISCDWCSSMRHEMAECQAMKEATALEEQVNFMANARVNNPYSNTYNPGWRNHPNFSWASPTNPRPPVSGPHGKFPTSVDLHPTKTSSPRLKLPQVGGRVWRFHGNTPQPPPPHPFP